MKIKIEINANKKVFTIEVENKGDRPVQVGSHYHFFEVNSALDFERSQAYGKRLDVAAGTSVRFEPGSIKSINLIDKGLYKSKKIGEVVETTKETQTQLRSQMGKLVFELISKQKHEKNIAFEDYKNNQFNSITNQREENFLNYEQNNNDFTKQR